jgi:methylmalonyl-CoA mutase
MEEAGLARVEDPAGGSWFLEAQTDQLARAAWALFQEIEQAGDLLSALESGLVARWADEGRAMLAAEVRSGARKLVGASVYRPSDPAPVAVETLDAARFARPVPELRLPGPDSRCRPLTPWRVSGVCEEMDA